MRIALPKLIVGRRREPVVGRLTHSASIRVAEVIVGHSDRAPRVDGHRGREGGFAVGVAGHSRPTPVSLRRWWTWRSRPG